MRKEKCRWAQQEVKWFGHMFNMQGMFPDPDKVEHIKAWPRPEDKDAVKSFLQTVQFCARYMREEDGETYANITAPLRELTKTNVRFVWSKECEKAFNKLKSRLMKDTVLVNYDPERETRLYVDHRPRGIASTVAQKYEEEDETLWKAVDHNGRSLENAEIGYLKIEGESLAIYSGIMMNRK